MKGTITGSSLKWLTIEHDGPPITTIPGFHSSQKVLTWGPGGWPQINYYKYTTKEWEANETNGLPFKITHYAYYNTPE